MGKWAGWILIGALVLESRCDAQHDSAESDWVREATVAGKFYPGDADKLKAAVRGFLDDSISLGELESPMAILAPHAGYIFSGQIAADAFSAVKNRDVELVVILGTNHRAAGFDDIAVWPRGAFRTPLGVVDVDEVVSRELISTQTACVVHDAAHLEEHSVEVQLPFVQVLFPKARIVAAVMGTTNLEKCRVFGEALADIVRDRKVLIVASSDFSHYPSYENAKKTDLRVLDAVVSMDPVRVQETIEKLEHSGVDNLATCACGQGPVLATMWAAKKLGAPRAFKISYANSGDVTLGDAGRVVGYGAVAFAKKLIPKTQAKAKVPKMSLDLDSKKELLDLARHTIERYLKTETIPLVRGFSGISAAHRGVFVTLNKHGALRGCIGHMAQDMALCKCVSAMALQAAFSDRRFSPVSLDELDDIEIEISVLTPMTRVSGPGDFVVGRDGVQIRKGGRSAVFLPQVAPEQGWTREETLNHLCQKAGLPAQSWRKDMEFYTFQALVFGEHDLGDHFQCFFLFLHGKS